MTGISEDTEEPARTRRKDEGLVDASASAEAQKTLLFIR
jgi:hypothetical protein